MMAVCRILGSVAALVFTVLLLAGEASAQSYPSRPVRLIVPFGAGGPTDVIARVVAQRLSEAWGQQVITENIPGAGGNTGVAMVAKAPADGYTILVVSTGFMVNPSMYSKIPYDPVKDFAPVTLVAASPNVISVASRAFPPRRSRSSSSWSKPIPANTALRSPPPAPRRTSPASCSSRNTGSTWSPCRSTARRWRSTRPSAATRRSPSRRCRRP